MNGDRQQKRSQKYQETLQKHGESPQALQWADYRAAAIRYRALVQDLALEGKSVLDAGCGMGDLLPYLYAHAASFDYLGIDITPSFIAIARKRYAGHSFEVGNPFDGSIAGNSFDVVISCGVLNANTGGWLAERKRMIAALFNIARETLVFNMAGGTDMVESTRKVAYADAAQLEAFCKTLSPDVTLRTGYHPKDFTIVIKRA